MGPLVAAFSRGTLQKISFGTRHSCVLQIQGLGVVSKVSVLNVFDPISKYNQVSISFLGNLNWSFPGHPLSLDWLN